VGVLVTRDPSQLTERYLRHRHLEYFHGQNDNEYLVIVTASCGALHVHLTQTAVAGFPMTIQVTPPHFFPATDRPRLMRLARRWNRRGGLPEVILYRSVDTTRIGVVAEGPVPADDGITFEEFTDVIDTSIARAAEFFGEIAAVLERRRVHSRHVWLPNAS
jgi:hypothetical protein